VVSGITGASPIWHAIMTHLLDGTKTTPLIPPSNAIKVSVCKQSGLLPAPGATCETSADYFIKGKYPNRKDPGKSNVWVDKTTQDLPKDPKQTDNLELKEHYVVEDDLHDKYCVDCAHPSASPTPTP
jgi:membrane carboxypeptidase/penicillin-binding protein